MACNTVLGIVYFWGSYRSEVRGIIFNKGRFYGPVKEPTRVGLTEFKNKKITKILSGENHAMVLCDNRVYVWGDPETGVIYCILVYWSKTNGKKKI